MHTIIRPSTDRLLLFQFDRPYRSYDRFDRLNQCIYIGHEWLFLDTWEGFLPWKNEKHSSITLFSDASDVGWGGSIRVPGKEDQLIRGYWDEVMKVMKCIFQLTLRSNLAPSTYFVPSADNPADRPSRTLSDIDCKLSPIAWKLVQQAYGPHSLDLFALASNVQCDSNGRPLRFFALT